MANVDPFQHHNQELNQNNNPGGPDLLQQDGPMVEGWLPEQVSGAINKVIPGGLRVLVADSDARDCDLTVNFLESCGYKVIRVSHSIDLHSKIFFERHGVIDLIVVECQLPGNFGNTLKEIKKKHGVPMVGLSRFTDLSSQTLLMSLGVCECFYKPVATSGIHRIWQLSFNLLRDNTKHWDFFDWNADVQDSFETAVAYLGGVNDKKCKGTSVFNLMKGKGIRYLGLKEVRKRIQAMKNANDSVGGDPGDDGVGQGHVGEGAAPFPQVGNNPEDGQQQGPAEAGDGGDPVGYGDAVGVQGDHPPEDGQQQGPAEAGDVGDHPPEDGQQQGPAEAGDVGDHPPEDGQQQWPAEAPWIDWSVDEDDPHIDIDELIELLNDDPPPNQP